MNNNRSNSNSDQPENGFYKGLVYGVVLGLGIVWFLGTKEGKKVKEEIVTRGEELLSNSSEKIETYLASRIDEENQ